jgi:glycosyltransferase involved in cell wall biosynthesis
MTPSIRLVTIVEATAVNAVAKTVFEFYRTARELAQEDNEFPNIEGLVVTFERQRDSRSEFLQAATDLGLEVEVIPEMRRFDLKVLPALRRIVERNHPDLILTNSVKSHFLLWRSGLWQTHPWIAFHHGYTETDRKMRLYNRLDRWSLPHADQLVTVCRAFAQDLADSTGVSLEKISVQHNSVRRQPTVTTGVLRNRLGITESERVVLAVGRLSREKGHIDLIEAFKILLKSRSDISARLIIAGDGPERSRLEAVTSSPEMKGRVVFAGQVSNVQPFYAIANVFALPSHSEGSPNVLLEAMAASVPIVATSVGGVPEIVENEESALLVPMKDPAALSSALATLLTDSNLRARLVKNAATLVDTKYDPENYVRSLVKTYREAVDRRRGEQVRE